MCLSTTTFFCYHVAWLCLRGLGKWAEGSHHHSREPRSPEGRSLADPGGELGLPPSGPDLLLWCSLQGHRMAGRPQRTGREAQGATAASGEGRAGPAGVGPAPDHDVGDAKVGQGLPGLDEAQLGLGQRKLGHVLVGFQDPWGELRDHTGEGSSEPLRRPACPHQGDRMLRPERGWGPAAGAAEPGPEVGVGSGPVTPPRGWGPACSVPGTRVGEGMSEHGAF